MSIRQTIPPLPQDTAIVDPKTGLVTIAFQQWWQQLTQNGDFAFDSIDEKLDNEMATARILGRDTAGTGEVEQLTITEALDLLTGAAQGDIIYRGASSWDNLAAGTSGHFLKTQGAAANPVWAAVSAGSSVYEAGPPTPPTTADLSTWLNQDTSTATDGTSALVLKPDVNDQVHSLVKAVPSAPFDVYCRVQIQSFSTGGVTTTPAAAAGIVFRDSADSELLIFNTRYERIVTDEQNLYEVRCDRFTADGGTYSATPIVKYTTSSFVWLRVNVSALSSGTLTFYVSTDGRNWISMGTETTAAFIDAITHYGIGAWANAAATEAAAVFSYFSTTAPS